MLKMFLRFSILESSAQFKSPRFQEGCAIARLQWYLRLIPLQQSAILRTSEEDGAQEYLVPFTSA
jgi:hypothetical protein